MTEGTICSFNVYSRYSEKTFIEALRDLADVY